MDDYFSLQVAMEEGFFSDLALVCCNGVALQAHKVVLELACPSMTLQEWNTLFSLFGGCGSTAAPLCLHRPAAGVSEQVSGPAATGGGVCAPAAQAGPAGSAHLRLHPGPGPEAE